MTDQLKRARDEIAGLHYTEESEWDSGHNYGVDRALAILDRIAAEQAAAGVHEEEQRLDLGRTDAAEPVAEPMTGKCECVGQYGPNPDCGRCGGDGDAAPMATPAAEPVAWAEVYDGKVYGLAMRETRFHTEPLVLASPPPSVAPTDDTALVEAREAYYQANLQKGPNGHLSLNSTYISAFNAGWFAALASRDAAPREGDVGVLIREVYEAGWETLETFCYIREDSGQVAVAERMEKALCALRDEMPEVDRPQPRTGDDA